MQPVNEFSASLARAVLARSLLDVADALGVAPRTVYNWIAETERPEENLVPGFIDKLSSMTFAPRAA
jgi:hypothetical protein